MTNANICKMHDRDHNQSTWSSQIPRTPSNTRTNRWDKWINGRQKIVRKTVSNHLKDNLKQEDGMTVSSHPKDTFGGGCGIFSNADGDVPRSILHKKHNASTDSANCENEMTTRNQTRDTAGARRGAPNTHSDVSDEHFANRCTWAKHSTTTTSNTNTTTTMTTPEEEGKATAAKKMLECRKSIRWASQRTRRLQMGRRSSIIYIQLGASGVAQKHGANMFLNKKWKRIDKNTSANGWLPQQSSAIVTKSTWPMYTSHIRDTRTCTSKRCTKTSNQTATKNETSLLSLDLGLTLKKIPLVNTKTGQPNKRRIWMKQCLTKHSNVAPKTSYKVSRKTVHFQILKWKRQTAVDRKNRGYCTDAEANDINHFGSDHTSVTAHFRFPRARKKEDEKKKNRNIILPKDTKHTKIPCSIGATRCPQLFSKSP